MIGETSLLFSITLLAYFIKGLTGFGNTLVMNSLLSFFIENRLITPIDLLLSIPANTYLAWKNRHHINFKVVIPLFLAVIIGNIPGILLLSIGSDHFLKVILGVVLILLAIEMQIHKSGANPRKGGPWLFGVIGVASGFLMGLFGIGALLAAGINRYTENRNEYRGNLCFVFIFDNVFRCIAYGWRSIFNWHIFMLSLMLFPAILLGMGLSAKLDLHLREDHIRKGILALLVVSGVLLIINNVHT
ncbi:MAG TPA: sulfite exporter TauE/SafE family protein [Firmicutes bacterium]|jgi:uncharacterized protein|nr:sulfite exporter TauE/SafE family protein [Bacillota bacterium]